jgi:hypothetical protein
MTLEARAQEAFVYGLPTVDMYRILHDFALDPESSEFKAPLNVVAHSRRLADPDDLSIVAMNVDTPYSYCWVDLRGGPMVLTLPAVEDHRYMSAQVIDLYTYIVGYLSPRTHGSAGGSVILVGPNDMPDDADGLEAMECPSDLCLVLIRTQLFDDADMPNVAALQDQVSVTPLAAWPDTGFPVRTGDALVTIPPADVRSDPTPEFLSVLDWMLRLMPVIPDEAAVRHRLAMLGVTGDPAMPFHPDPDELEALLNGLAAGRDEVLARMATVRSSAELFGSREHFAGDYLSKAAGAYLGILGNAAEEYLGVGYRVDANGKPFDGQTDYAITFPSGGLPPVGAFWSITVYDHAQHLYPNELDRYVISSRHVEDMRHADDGSLTILVQNARPAEGDVANWLPCPAGPFGLTFRTYLPGPAIRSGAWTAPPVTPTRGA